MKPIKLTSQASKLEQQPLYNTVKQEKEIDRRNCLTRLRAMMRKPNQVKSQIAERIKDNLLKLIEEGMPLIKKINELKKIKDYQDNDSDPFKEDKLIKQKDKANQELGGIKLRLTGLIQLCLVEDNYKAIDKETVARLREFIIQLHAISNNILDDKEINKIVKIVWPDSDVISPDYKYYS